MNKKLKRRLAAVTGAVIIVFIVVLAIIASGTAAKSLTVAEVLAGEASAGDKVQVSGIVAEDSYALSDGTTTFAIYDEDGDESQTLAVSYDGSVSATFGAGITAICTGTLGSDGVLSVTELVTKCPSKYENSDESLGVDALLAYGDDIVGTAVKVAGVVESGSIGSLESDVRFVLLDAESGTQLSIVYDGALSDEVQDGSSVVVTGILLADGSFEAEEVALEDES